jgi:hypothetical protein
MVFYKLIEKVDASDKYGDGQQMIVAAETIAAGERIWWCTCGDDDYMMSRDEILHLIEARPQLRNFLCWYSYMVNSRMFHFVSRQCFVCSKAEDDMYMIPRTFLEQQNNDECVLFNHSCEPNCGFDAGDGNTIVAIRSIAIGEELTYDYHFLETEPSLIRGLACKCQRVSCVGTLMFDRYRDEEFQKRYYDFMSPYLRARVRELKNQWYSTKCYTRSANNEKSKSLHALEWISIGEIVARFTGSVSIDNHFIRCADELDATCFVDEHKQVIALCNLPPEAEITLNYHGKLYVRLR